MKRVMLGLFIMVVGFSAASAAEHVSCANFLSLEKPQQVIFARGILDGIAVSIGVVDASVVAVERATSDQVQAKGAALAIKVIQKTLSSPVDESDEVFTKSVAAVCARSESADRPAASAALDVIMGLNK